VGGGCHGTTKRDESNKGHGDVISRVLTWFDMFLPIPMTMGYEPANIGNLLEIGKFE